MPDIEEQPKIRVSLEEQRMMTEGELKPTFDKMVNKLTKDCNYRNAAIKKSYQEYAKEYEPFASIFKKEQEIDGLDGKKTSEKVEKKIQFRLKQLVTVK